MTRLRLCIATPLYPPELGGPATYTKILEQELPKKDIEVTLVKFSDVRQLPTGIRHIQYFWNVYRELRMCDAALALDPVSTGLPALLAARLRGKPFFIKAVGDYAWEQGSQRAGITETLDEFSARRRLPQPLAFLRGVQRLVARSASAVIVPSQYMAQILKTWGVADDQLQVIYNAIEPPMPANLPNAIEELEGPIVVSVGRLVPWKGFAGLISAVAAVRKAMPNLALAIVGEGPDRAVLEAQAATELGSSYVFTGALTQDSVAATLAHADVFVLNSTYEGLSHVLVEALTSGTPVIATRAGGNPEVVHDRENGLLVSVGNTEELVLALTEILTNTTLRSQLRANAAPSVASFSIEAMVTKTTKLFLSFV